MFVVWILNKEGTEDIPLTTEFSSLNKAFEYKELLKQKYPGRHFVSTSGIPVEQGKRKSLKDALNV